MTWNQHTYIHTAVTFIFQTFKKLTIYATGKQVKHDCRLGVRLRLKFLFNPEAIEYKNNPYTETGF